MITVVGVPEAGMNVLLMGVVMPETGKPDPTLIAVLINREHCQVSS